jgi:hypothetical protein
MPPPTPWPTPWPPRKPVERAQHSTPAAAALTLQAAHIVNLESGGALSVAINAPAANLSPRDSAFLFRLVHAVLRYESGRGPGLISEEIHEQNEESEQKENK